jgi:hypothetical protein
MSGGYYYEAYTIGSQNYFALQWHMPPYWMATSEYEIRMVLEETTGMIHVCYVNTDVGDIYYDDGAYAVTGIQQNSSSGLEATYLEASLPSGTHMWYVPPS